MCNIAFAVRNSNWILLSYVAEEIYCIYFVIWGSNCIWGHIDITAHPKTFDIMTTDRHHHLPSFFPRQSHVSRHLRCTSAGLVCVVSKEQFPKLWNFRPLVVACAAPAGYRIFIFPTCSQPAVACRAHNNKQWWRRDVIKLFICCSKIATVFSGRWLLTEGEKRLLSYYLPVDKFRQAMRKHHLIEFQIEQ